MTVPLALPLLPVPSTASDDPDPAAAMTCPAVVTTSFCPAGTSGQVKLAPPLVTVDPGVTPLAASAWAE